MGWFAWPYEAFGEVRVIGGGVLKESKRYRLSGEELELVLVGLLLLVEQSVDCELSDDALGLAGRLVQGRRGRPGGGWSGVADGLWKRASMRARVLRRMMASA